jgi:hypothetical protein
MSPVFRLSLAALSMLLVSPSAALLAQDSAMMKKDSMMDTSAMGHRMTMRKDSMGEDMSVNKAMMSKDMMGPHASFAGRHDHKVSGGYSIVERGGKRVLMLGEDFFLDGAPDPYVVLSADEMGSGASTLNLGRLKRQKGASAFPLPAGADLTRYSHVLIWCRKFNVTLAQAELAPSDKMMHN